MKAHLAKVSLALLSVAFLLGCQERGSEPVGPEGLGPAFDPGGGGKGGSGKKGGTVLADLTMTNGWLTPAGAEVVSFKDGKKKIEFQYRDDGVFSVAANMTNTHLAAGRDATTNDVVIVNGNIPHKDGGVLCFSGGRGTGTDDELRDLFNQLVDGKTTRPSTFFVTVDKTVLESDDHRAQFAWPNEEAGSRVRAFILRVGTFSPLPDLIAKVSVSGVLGDIDPPLTVVFTDGSIRLGAFTGSTPDNFNLTCRNEDDTITMKLTSPPSS